MTTEESRDGLCPHGEEFAPIGGAWGTKYRTEAGVRVPIICECCNIPVGDGETRCLSCPPEEATDD